MEIEHCPEASMAKPRVFGYIPMWEERWVERRLGQVQCIFEYLLNTYIIIDVIA